MISWNKLVELFNRCPKKFLEWLHSDLDRIKLVGHFKGTFSKDGKVLSTVEDKNIIVTSGKIYVLQLLGGLSGVQSVTKMAVGDGGCGASPFPTSDQLNSPIPFTLSDTDLRHQVTFDTGGTQPLTSTPVVNTPGQYVTFEVTFNSSQVVTASFGFTPNFINEAALISGNGQVLALRSFESHPFARASSIEFKCEWKVSIA